MGLVIDKAAIRVENYLTAKEAAEKFKNISSEHIKYELCRILKEIDTQATNGNSREVKWSIVKQPILNKLKELGYKIEQHDAIDQRDVSYITISY